MVFFLKDLIQITYAEAESGKKKSPGFPEGVTGRLIIELSAFLYSFFHS